MRQEDVLRLITEYKQAVPLIKQREKLLTQQNEVKLERARLLTDKVLEELVMDKKEDLTTWIDDLSRGIMEYETSVKKTKETVALREEEIAKLKESNILLDKVQEAYKIMIDRTTGAYFRTIEETLNQAFQYIYEQPNKRVQLLIREFRGSKTLKVQVVEHRDGKDYLVELEDEGVSVQVTLGLVFMIYFILYSGHPRVIFLDETTSAFQSVRLDKLMTFLRYFVDNYSFSFVYVSHDDRVLPYTDRSYSVRNGEYFECQKD